MTAVTAQHAAALDFTDWGYRYASRADFSVRGFSLHVPAGQRVLLLGASGLGKSTILEAAAGLIGSSDSQEDEDGGQSEGKACVGGVPAPQALGRVGLVLQDPDAQVIFERLGDNVAFGPENRGVPREEIWRRVARSLEDVGLDGIPLDHETLHLSGGQTQRLALAGALAMRPDVLLLDEPTANLDPDGVRQVVRAVHAVVSEYRPTMVLVEHRADPWLDLLDRVVVVGQGSGKDGQVRTEVLADGTPEEVFTRSGLDFGRLGIWVPRRFARSPEPVLPGLTAAGNPGEEAAWGRVVLRTEGLSIGCKGRAIAGPLDLEFRSHEITALMGRNGAGKSTLALTLSGLLAPVSGRVAYLGGQGASPEASAGRGPRDPEGTEGRKGVDPISLSSRALAARVAYVFQNPEHQFARPTVLQEAMLAPLRTGMGEEAARRQARDLLREFGLERFEDANPYTLSGGQKRRLSVVSSLAASPSVMILDEPTFGQDRTSWEHMVRLIARLRDRGICVIVITHDRLLVRTLGARVIRLEETGKRNGPSPEPVSSPSRPTSGDVPDGPHRGSSREERVAVTPINDRPEPARSQSPSPVLARMNPAFRMIGALVATIPLIASLDTVSAMVSLVCVALFLVFVRYPVRPLLRETWPVLLAAPMSALSVVLYGKRGGRTLAQWGPVLVSDRSVQLALDTGLRVLAIGIPAIVLIMGMDATDWADSLTQILHWPDRFVYGGLAGMRLFPLISEDWTALGAARRSRGLGDENRVARALSQAFALLVLSIRRSTALATAMQARGFGGPAPRTQARVSTVSGRDWALLAGCLLIPVISLGAAGICGTFSFLGRG